MSHEREHKPQVPVRHAVREVLTASRFFIVGVLATLTHAVIAVSLTEADVMQPLAANCVAFAIAFIVSFSGHHFWSFPGTENWNKRLIRFFTLSFSGFVANTWLLSSLLKWAALPEAVSIVLAIGVIPLVTYLGARFWAFVDPSDDTRT